MFGFGVKKEGGFEGKLNCIIGEESSLRGDLDVKGSARIDGALEGSVAATESVIVGRGALIKADVQGKDVVVAGRVVGNLRAHERVELHAGARVDGDIETRTFIVDEGVVFNGKCAMVEVPVEAQASSGPDQGAIAQGRAAQPEESSRERELTRSGYGSRE